MKKTSASKGLIWLYFCYYFCEDLSDYLTNNFCGKLLSRYAVTIEPTNKA